MVHNSIIVFSNHLHTPQLPPFLAQYLQYLQFLQAVQSFEPVHFLPAV
jgi:hypothetical protein